MWKTVQRQKYVSKHTSFFFSGDACSSWSEGGPLCRALEAPLPSQLRQCCVVLVCPNHVRLPPRARRTHTGVCSLSFATCFYRCCRLRVTLFDTAVCLLLAKSVGRRNRSSSKYTTLSILVQIFRCSYPGKKTQTRKLAHAGVRQGAKHCRHEGMGGEQQGFERSRRGL